MIVHVYRNLHRDCLSIVAREGEHKGRVIGYADAVGLLDAHYKVSQSGRCRVLREQKKNVHAVILGELIGLRGFKSRLYVHSLLQGCSTDELAEMYLIGDVTTNGLYEVTYNPYTHEQFMYKDKKKPIEFSVCSVVMPHYIGAT